ncbi:LysE family translocator [Xenorhabdus budapestensis]|uniref:LysE family translocator n=1 Tax=Xenorhabdus budapestensis TaxID=290110 RepID=A0A2D0J1W5_XENBU|nr:LysE family translocator [Xenorhabdus budapestensis]PHM28261.1 lysine transporter LysE [Xenorhabdus budapestensis]QTL40444.1 LysE family translocator [Xenorhabdus budapestensis]
MLSDYLHEFWGLALIHFLAVVAPGPDFAVTLRQSIRFGRWMGICTAIGIGAGISVHVIYTLIGIGALIHSTPWLMTIAKMIGGIYICYLGVQFIRSKPEKTDFILPNEALPQQRNLRRAFSTGFMTNATNPKATLFFLAVFTTIVSATTPLSVQIFYGVWMCIVNAAWFILVSCLFSSPTVRLQFVRLGHWFERAVGVVLIGFAVRLLFISV